MTWTAQRKHGEVAVLEFSQRGQGLGRERGTGTTCPAGGILRIIVDAKGVWHLASQHRSVGGSCRRHQ